MKEIKNSAYRSAWVPDYCDDLGPKIWNADNWQDGLIHNVVRITPARRRIAIDCGANIGMTTIALAHYFEQVYAFEADPLTYECLVKNTEFLDNVICINAAVSDASNKPLRFVRTEEGVSGHTHILNKEVDETTANVFTVNSVTLDGHRYSKCVDFIKMDIEGCEYDALHGSVQLLKKHRPVLLIEMSKAKVLAFDDFYMFLREYGYIFVDKIGRDFLFICKDRSATTKKYFAMQKSDRVANLVRKF